MGMQGFERFSMQSHHAEAVVTGIDETKELASLGLRCKGQWVTWQGSPAEARMIAASLLNTADKIDGIEGTTWS